MPLRPLAALALVLLLAPAFARAAERRLDYRQDTSLKDAAFYLNQSDALVAAIEKEVADWKPGDATIPVNKVNVVIATRDKVNQNLTSAQTRLTQLPADHSRVAPELKRFDAIKARLAATDEKVQAVQKAVAGAVGQGDAPEYKIAFDRLREIIQMFSNTDGLRDGHPTADQAETARQLPAAKAERQRIAAKYDALLKQPTPQSQDMANILATAEQTFAAYDKALAAYLAATPAALEKDADDILALAKEGVEKKKPGYFGEHGGVTGRLNAADQRLGVLTALAPDAESTKRAAEKLRATRASVDQTAAQFMTDLVAANRPPADDYTGPDRDALLQLLADKWAKDGNGVAVLKIGIISKDFRRQVKWEWRDAASAWEKSDKSRNQGYVITKLSDTEAALWPIDLVKDHLSHDTVGAYLLYNPKEPPSLRQRILLTNLK